MHLKNLLYLSLLGFSPVLADSHTTPLKTEITWSLQHQDSTALTLDQNVRYGKLENGLTYYIRKNIEPQERVFMYLVNHVGSMLENEQQRGLAHFLEHMAFNGTKHFPKNKLVDYLQKNGISFGADINAYTSFDETVYQLQLPSNDSTLVNNGFRILQDWAQDISLDHEEIDKERGVIMEEKRAGKSVSERIQEKTLPIAFNHSRYAQRLPIGTEEVIQFFPYPEIKDFYTTWYRPDLQAVIVVGDVDVDNLERQIKQVFSTHKNPENAIPRPAYSIPLEGKNQFMAVTDPEITSTSIDISIKHPERKIRTSADYRDAVVRALFNDMIANRYTPLFRTANPPFLGARASIGEFMGGIDVFQLQVTGKPDRLEEGFKALWREIWRAKHLGFSANELSRAKNTYLTQMENVQEEKDKIPSYQYIQEYIQHYLHGVATPGIDREMDLIREFLPTITLTDIQKLLEQYLKDSDRDIVVLAPEKDEDSLPKEADILGWIEAVSQEKLQPYTEDAIDLPLLKNSPKAGKIIHEQRDEKLGTTTWTFNNNVRVELKPTNFQNNQITFQGFSYGGTSLYDDEDYQSAANAVGLVTSSGLGNYSADQFEKSLAGHTVSVSPFISETAQGVSAYSNNKDLELALQILYGYFTEPRLDTAIVAGILANAKDGLKDRGKNGDVVFQDSVMAILSGNSIRRTGMSPAKIDQIDPQRALEIYRERFGNASGFQFSFVGSFDIEKIKPLLIKYIGGLPAKGRKQPKYRNLNINIPAGHIEKKLPLSKEDKATVYIVLSGDYSYGAANNLALQAFSDVLDIRLLERLREEEGGVYSPSIYIDYNKIPDERYTLTINFSCSAGNVDKLIRYSLEEIEKLKTEGPSLDNLNKFIANDKLSYESAIKTNDFWSNYLYSKSVNREHFHQVFERSALRETLTVEKVKEVAKKFISDKNVIRIVQLPETTN